MGLPNLSKTVLRFAQTVTKRTPVQSVVNHLPVKTYADTSIKATITTPTSTDMISVEVDTSLSYKLIHSVESIKIDDIIVHQSTSYRIISLSNRVDYGYFRAIGEEVQL